MEHKDKILAPPNQMYRNNLHYIDFIHNIMNKIYGKVNLDQNDIIKATNTSNGNCFYNIISQFFHITEIYNIYYRK